MEENGDEFIALQIRAADEPQNCKICPASPRRSSTFSRRAQELQVQLGFLMESEDHNTVFWIERRVAARDQAVVTAVYLQATPIDVAPILKARSSNNSRLRVLTQRLWPWAGASNI